MYATDRDALLCDMAETYHIFNLQALPVSTLAALAFGLSPDSRIKRKLSGMKTTAEVLLLGMAVDRLSLLVWMQSKDGPKGRNRPKSIVAALLAEPKEKQRVRSFDTPEAFETARAKITGG